MDRQTRKVLNEVLNEIEQLKAAPADVITATAWVWPLRHEEDGVYSVEFMSDEEIQQAAVEQLLISFSLRLEGKETGGDIDHHVRFLAGEHRSRAIAAFNAPFVQSLIKTSSDGAVELDPDHLQDAMDFSGYWLEGWEPLTDGNVYRAAPGI
jgi:hypothetical protein